MKTSVMRHLFIGMVCSISCIFSIHAQNEIPFMRTEELPQVTEYLPNYPGFNSPLFHNDSVMYEIGKSIRSTARGKQAVEDADTSLEYFMTRFGKVMNRDLTPRKYPELAVLMKSTYRLIRSTISNAKDFYARKRPYQYFKEASAIPADESPADYTSYPSGHSIRAWALALLLVNIDPAHQEDILKVGYELGQSRVIAGYHFQSDVDASRLVASAGMARLYSSPAFQKQLKKAVKEFKRRK